MGEKYRFARKHTDSEYPGRGLYAECAFCGTDRYFVGLRRCSSVARIDRDNKNRRVE